MNKTNHIRLTKEVVNSRLESRNIKLIGDYINSGTKTTFQCENEHQWKATASNVLSGTRCPICTDVRLTKNIINERLIGREIEMIGEYYGAHSKSTFRCKNNHEWSARTNSVVNMNNGCPECASNIFDKNKPTYAYILKFDDFVKYGITNDLDTRLKAHKINGSYELSTSRLFEKGIYAREWEITVKSTLGGNYCSREQFDNGYTETLSLDSLNNVINMLNNFTYDK
jgi:hypothetical protein